MSEECLEFLQVGIITCGHKMVAGQQSPAGNAELTDSKERNKKNEWLF